MLSPIKYESNIILKDIPIQWIPHLELYYSDLPQFPIVYVHMVIDGVRVYGFPAYISVGMREGKYCDIEAKFLSNVDLDGHRELKETVLKELEERFGASRRVGIDDILKCCNGKREYEEFFKDLWRYVSDLYGEYIPYGRYYEEVYSIVRFVSAWNPKTGRQSEMRMLYNFLSIFGEPVKVEGKWNYLSFFLLPTYDNILKKELSDFPKFRGLFNAMKKMWDIYFTRISSDFTGTKIRAMVRSWPRDKDSFIQKVSYPLYTSGKLSVVERNDIERLVDAFNRHSWRAAYFIWSIMSIFDKDYRSWDKEYFTNFYSSDYGVGISEKAVACFLQQGFGNEEVVPVDRWVEAFFTHALGMRENQEFFRAFSKLGKLERAIWLSSQAKKTNISTFFDLLWCTRYGDTGNNELRGPNPISCYECKLRLTCVGFNKIRNRNVRIVDKNKVTTDGKYIKSASIVTDVAKNNCLFVCLSEDKVPKKIYKKQKSRLKLIDEFSGYLLTTQKVPDDNAIVTVGQLVDSLPPYTFDSSLVPVIED